MLTDQGFTRIPVLTPGLLQDYPAQHSVGSAPVDVVHPYPPMGSTPADKTNPYLYPHPGLQPMAIPRLADNAPASLPFPGPGFASSGKGSLLEQSK